MPLLPLESNPEVLNKFLTLMGVPDKWTIVDVYGLDNDALAWVPRPVLAVILLFPCSQKFYDYAATEAATLKEKGQHIDPNLFFMKQFVSNTCGTMALIHSVANNRDKIELSDGPFKKVLEESQNLTPEERGELFLKHNNSTMKLMSAHQELAKEGQTEVNPNEQVNHHFVALIEVGGNLYELDGRKEFPINHGPTSKETLLEDAAKVCLQFIERDKEDVNFTVMALTAADQN